MPLTIHVTRQELCDLFDALGIWDKIQRQECTIEYIIRTQVPARNYPHATSTMARVRNSLGFQIATVHLIFGNDTGDIMHRDASDLVVEQVKLERQMMSKQSR